MSDNNSFNGWKSSRACQMQDLSLAMPDDLFIYTRFISSPPCSFEGSTVLFADDLREAAGYMRHVFLYDILNDMTDDMRFDPEKKTYELQQDAISILNFWFKLGKIMSGEKFETDFNELYKEFNQQFNEHKGNRYEFVILDGAKALCDFLISRYEKHPDFDRKKLYDICGEEMFAGRPLQEYINKLLG